MTPPGGLGFPHPLTPRDPPSDHQLVQHPDINYRRRGDGPSPSNVAVLDDASSTGRKRGHVDKRETPVSHWNINYGPRLRRDSPFHLAPVPTTSFDWWPYPAWSVTASLAAPSPLQTLPVVTITATGGSPPSSTTTDSSTSTNPTSSSSASSSSTDSSTASVVSISALPPATSNSSNSSTRDFNIVYLTPVFAVVGIALGALAAILGRRLYRRRRAARRPRSLSETSLEPGPPYMPAATFDENGMQQVDLHAASAGSRPGGYSRQGSTYSGAGNGLARNGSVTTFNGLLAPPADKRAASPRPHNTSAQVTSPDQPSIYSFSEHEDAPYDARGQSDIRRGILERLLVRSPSPVRGGRGGADAYTAVRPTSPRSSVTGPGGGFRIVEEDPNAASRAESWRSPDDLQDAIDREASASWLAWTKAWSPASTHLASPRSVAGEDKYTAVPLRKAAAERKTPRLGSPAPGPARVERDHSAVLGRSPPQVRSPPLDSQLLYSPTISTTAPLQTGRARAGPATVSPRQTRSPRHKERRKPRTPNTPPLPFPASECKSPYRHRLTRPRPDVETSSLTDANDSGASSIVSPVRATSPAERHAARKTALNKVEQIVAQSWSERDMTPRSPTMFGAVQHPVDDAAWTGGIEQRLATVDEKEC